MAICIAACLHQAKLGHAAFASTDEEISNNNKLASDPLPVRRSRPDEDDDDDNDDDDDDGDDYDDDDDDYDDDDDDGAVCSAFIINMCRPYIYMYMHTRL